MALKAFSMALSIALGSGAAYASGIQIIEDNYATFQRVCMADGQMYEDVDSQGRYKEREENQVCYFVTPQGELYTYADDQYKMIVNWVTPNKQSTWDELALYYNNVMLRFGDNGRANWAWDGFKILKDEKGVFALIAKRSYFNVKDQHFIVVFLNEDKSCRIDVPASDRFKGLSAFKKESQAMAAAKKLQSRKNVACELMAKYLH